MFPNNKIPVGNHEFSVFLCANFHETKYTTFSLDMPGCFEFSQMCFHQGKAVAYPLENTDC